MVHLSEAFIPSQTEYAHNRDSEFIIAVSSFEEFGKALYAYWQREQRLASRFAQPKETNVFVVTEKDPRDPNGLITSMHFMGPKGPVIFEEGYHEKTKQRPNFTDECIFSGLIYAASIQALAHEGFDLIVTYVDQSSVTPFIYKADRIKATMQDLSKQEVQPLGGAVKVLNKITEKPLPK
jgi:hypothetical protein